MGSEGKTPPPAHGTPHISCLRSVGPANFSSRGAPSTLTSSDSVSACMWAGWLGPRGAALWTPQQVKGHMSNVSTNMWYGKAGAKGHLQEQSTSFTP